MLLTSGGPEARRGLGPDLAPPFGLPYHNLVFEARGEREFRFHRFMGSALRGAYGHSFRRLACAPRGCRDVRSCALAGVCPYATCFEPRAEYFGVASARYAELPRPFVILPPLDRVTGETALFGMRVFGRACDYLPYFVYAWTQAGEFGITQHKTRFTLRSVVHAPLDGGAPSRVFANGAFISSEPTEASRLWTTAGARRLRIRLITPLRLRAFPDGEKPIRFADLYSACVRRATTMVRFWGDGAVPDLSTLMKQADTVRPQNADVAWTEWDRWSNRQRRKMKQGGLTGSMEYAGDLAPFLPALRFGELLSIGKSTVFGLGQIAVEILDD